MRVGCILGTVHDMYWLWQAILVQELGVSRAGQKQAPPGQGSLSARAARHVLQAVQTFVALTQIQQVPQIICQQPDGLLL